MPIPDYQSLMLPVLRVTEDRQEYSLSEIRERIAVALQLSAADLEQRLVSNNQPLFTNRVAWAIQYLKAAKTIESIRRSIYRITDRGLLLLKSNPAELTVKSLRQFPEFLEFAGTGAPNPELEIRSAPQPDAKITPDESLDDSLQARRDVLIEDLLEAIKNSTPAGFERIVLDLMLAMGYGWSKDSGQVTGKSGDGGIDGIIQRDKLGLEELYLQAKRWENGVATEEIMKFSGGLTKRHAQRGVFITASRFTRDARQFVETLPQKIVLIDGKRLAELMIDHNVGVAEGKTLTLKHLNPDYFERL